MTQRTIPRMIKIARAETGNDSESEVNTSWTGNFNATFSSPSAVNNIAIDRRIAPRPIRISKR